MPRYIAKVTYEHKETKQDELPVSAGSYEEAEEIAYELFQEKHDGLEPEDIRVEKVGGRY